MPDKTRKPPQTGYSENQYLSHVVRTVVVALAIMLTIGSPAYADVVTWNLVGNYLFGYEVDNGNYGLPMDITSMNSLTGTFTATTVPGGSISGGLVQGSQISFVNSSDSGCCSAYFEGMIAPDGTMSGTLADNNGHGLFGGFWYTISGNATPVTLPDFQLFEYTGSANCPNLPAGDTGCFDFVNNTHNYAVTGFDVGNSNALSDSTTRTNWGADITSINYGTGPESTFAYFDNGASSANPLVHGSDSNFFYTTATSGSPFEVFADGPNGPVSCIGTTGGGCNIVTPEPRALSLLGAGLAALSFTLMGRSKSRR